jgi:hypothetical protein
LSPPPTDTRKFQDEELDFELPPEDDDDEINAVSSDGSDRKKRKIQTWDEIVAFNGRPLKMKVDSGATVCTISLRDFKRLGLSENMFPATQDCDVLSNQS